MDARNLSDALTDYLCTVAANEVGMGGSDRFAVLTAVRDMQEIVTTATERFMHRIEDGLLDDEPEPLTTRYVTWFGETNYIPEIFETEAEAINCANTALDNDPAVSYVTVIREDDPTGQYEGMAAEMTYTEEVVYSRDQDETDE